MTLYYLLTGTTPYQADNLVKLLATVLEQPAPSPAKHRPEIPSGLANAVLRCLAKQPAGRCKDYVELRRALLPYNSTAPNPATLALRFVAGACDHVLWSIPTTLAWFAFMGDFNTAADPAIFESSTYFVFIAIATVLHVIYFAIPEGIWGASLGKAICRVRVVNRNRGTIGISKAALRTVIYVVLPSSIIWSYTLVTGSLPFKPASGGLHSVLSLLVGYSYYFMLAVLFSTARRHNGYSGLHDLAVGAQVIQRSAYKARPILAVEEQTLPDTAEKEMIGPYHVLDSLGRLPNEEFILAYDTRLLRRVWIHCRPEEAPAVPAHRRNLGRSGRLRWINEYRDEEHRWDAYEALSGRPLAVLLRKAQPWSSVRYWLLDLAREFVAAEKDGTIPETLALDRIWIMADGRVKLLDFPAPGTQSVRLDPVDPAGSPRGLLRQVASAALQGSVDDEALFTGTQLPLAAGELLNELDDIALDEIVDRLHRLIRRTPRVTRLRRVAMLAATAAFPTMIALVMGFSIWFVNQWKAANPDLWELRNCLMTLEWGVDSQLARARTQQERDTVEAQRAALKTYIAGKHRDEITDPEKWNSLMSQSLIPDPLRRRAKELVKRPEPSAAEIEEAKSLVAPILQDFEAMEEMTNTMFSPLSMAALQFIGLWILCVAFPSFLTAILFRGGAVIHLFGVAFVTRKGKRASRSRMLWRAIVASSPIFFAPVALAFILPLVGDVDASLLPIIGCTLALAVFSCWLPRRGLHDMLAGTYPVMR